MRLLFAVFGIVGICVITRFFLRTKESCKWILLELSLYLIVVVYFIAWKSGRSGMGGINLRVPLPIWRAIISHKFNTVACRSLLNLLLFVPLGYLFPQITKMEIKMTRWWTVCLLGFLTSLLIEVSQFAFRFGVFEFDDLIKNTMGTGLGWLIWKVQDIRMQKHSDQKEVTNGHN
jgi:glycopeptide antibiotics resistance protein